MATIGNRSKRRYDIHSFTLRDKDGKVTRAAEAFHIMPSRPDRKGNPVIGTGEIPDDLLKELLAKDPFTKGAFEPAGGLYVIPDGEEVPATPVVEETKGPRLK